MNVYDFDGTIYDGDSSIDLYKYCLAHYPRIMLKLPKQLTAMVQYKMKKIDKTRMKEIFYTYFEYIPDMDKTLEDFWKKNEKKIYPWYMEQKQDTDIIISASPEFSLAPMCKKLGVGELMASRIDYKTGKCEGKNCWGEEKVVRYNAKHKDEVIDGFYSDSNSDLPLAKLATKAYFIKKGKVTDWKIEK